MLFRSFSFSAAGMSEVKQFEVIVAAEPAEAFDLNGAAFVPEKPFITVGSGIELSPDKHLRMAGILLSQPKSGNGPLGTLTLQTSAAFTKATQARIRILLFSIGPSSRERDRYEERTLNMGVEVKNP